MLNQDDEELEDLAAVLLVEIRASGDLQRTEPALFGTQGVLEEAIFEIKRGVTTTGSIAQYGCTTQAQGTPLNSIAITTSVCSRNPESVITETIVPAQAVDYATSKYKYYLIDPDDPYNCINEASPSQGTCYTRVLLHNIGIAGTHADLAVALCVIDQDDCLVSGWDNEDATVGPNETADFTLDAKVPYYFVVVNKSAGFGTPEQGFLEITSYGPTGALLGLPYFGKKVVDVNATYVGLTRRYRAIVPTQ
jgi:hypothetical protein